MKIKVYGTPSCVECKALKEWMKQEGIEFEEIDVSVDQESFSRVVNKTKQMKVPTIKIGDEYIVGFKKDDILNKIKK